MKPRTELIQVQKRDEENANQRWKYVEYRLVSEFDDSLCIWGKYGNVHNGMSAVVDTVQRMVSSQRWLLLPP